MRCKEAHEWQADKDLEVGCRGLFEVDSFVYSRVIVASYMRPSAYETKPTAT
jgi:hypothetical protein